MHPIAAGLDFGAKFGGDGEKKGVSAESGVKIRQTQNAEDVITVSVQQIRI